MMACVTDPEDPLPEIDMVLDDLVDKSNYSGTLVIDGRYYKGKQVDKILVNGLPSERSDVLELMTAGYYRIEVFQGGSDQQAADVIRIVILDPERGETEWGLPPWTPLEPFYGAIGDQDPLLLYTKAVPPGLSIPLVIILEGELTFSDSYLHAELGSMQFRIKRGVGSLQVPAELGQSNLKIDTRSFPLDISNLQATPRQLSGELQADVFIPPGSYIHIPGELTIPQGISLSIGSGSFISIDPEVNIINNGTLSFAGSASEPVTVTCSEEGAYWGGFIGRLDGNLVEASYTIFSRSGFNSGGEYSYGHAGRQALFYSKSGVLKLDHCYMIDHIGQVFYPLSCMLEISDCLIQRAKTGGQMNQSELLMNRCIFTDFPDDSDQYRDVDNDGLYLDECNVSISNSVFMYAKDDGLDSGAGGGGEVRINHCRFEANFHEGAALSSGGSSIKLHHIRNSVFTNNGQGLELGYSSPNHRVTADSCTFFANGIGIRYGDCYDWGAYRGFMHIQNSVSLENSYYDVWNMNRSDWAADTSRMSFENVYVSRPHPMYPELKVYE